jgi:hypothetical protein
MEYPEWAPKTLVEQHKRRTEGDQSARKFKTSDPETIIADINQRHGRDLTEANTENIRRKLYRKSMIGHLPDAESTALLEKLITNLTMKGVWIALAKRSKHERDPWQFFAACEHGIAGWRGDQKQTAAERRAFYQEIHDTAGKLLSLMHQASAFDFYSITKLVEDQTVEWLIEALGASLSDSSPAGQEISYARFCLSDVIPSSFEVLNDIGEKAKQYRDKSPIVKKPNSQNAMIHYFVRQLSSFCQSEYGQPLHEVVATTTAVIFDLPDCDDDYVRKIVKP